MKNLDVKIEPVPTKPVHPTVEFEFEFEIEQYLIQITFDPTTNEIEPLTVDQSTARFHWLLGRK